MIFQKLKNHFFLFFLLLSSWLLRCILALSGGAFFFPDEGRYLRSRKLLSMLGHAEINNSIKYLTSQSDHTGHIVAGLVPAFFEKIFAVVLGVPHLFFASTDFFNFVHPSEVWSDLAPIAVIVNSLASVACIGLVYMLARKFDADYIEAMWAAFLMSISTAFLFYSRYLLPYDISLMFALMGMCFGISKSGVSFFRSYTCGLLGGIGFLIYNGYWLICGISIVFHALVFCNTFRVSIQRFLFAVGGLLSFPLLLIALGYIYDNPYLTGLIFFSKTVNLGDYSEGYLLPIEYFWHAEHGLFIVWVICMAYVICNIARRRFWHNSLFAIFSYRQVMWLFGVFSIYLILVFGSNVLEKFVVYGRSSRQMIPFLSLITAFVIRHLEPINMQKLQYRWFIILMALVQTVVNFYPVLTQVYPFEVENRVKRSYGVISYDTSLVDMGWQYGALDPVKKYTLLNAQFLFPIKGEKEKCWGKIIYQTAHPLEYYPIQYDGFNRIERQILRTSNIRIQLIKNTIECNSK